MIEYTRPWFKNHQLADYLHNWLYNNGGSVNDDNKSKTYDSRNLIFNNTHGLLKFKQIFDL